MPFKGDPSGRLLLPVALAAYVLYGFDANVVNVAIPDLQRRLGAGPAALELVVGGYVFTYAAGVITGGRLGDLFGHRRLFLAGVTGFAAASLLCGLAQGPVGLVAARMAQGLTAGGDGPPDPDPGDRVVHRRRALPRVGLVWSGRRGQRGRRTGTRRAVARCRRVRTGLASRLPRHRGGRRRRRRGGGSGAAPRRAADRRRAGAGCPRGGRDLRRARAAAAGDRARDRLAAVGLAAAGRRRPHAGGRGALGTVGGAGAADSPWSIPPCSAPRRSPPVSR